MIAFILSQMIGYSLGLAWDQSPSPGVVGYRVYYGTSSGNYTNSVTFGDVTTASIPNLREMRTYYFAATAFDTNGIESTLSNEIFYSKPCVLKITQSQNGPSKVITISTDVYQGMTFNIEGSADLKTWNSVYSGTAATNSISIPFNPVAPIAFYRLKKKTTSPLRLLTSEKDIPPLTYTEPTAWEMRRWKLGVYDARKGAEKLMQHRKLRPKIPPPTPLRVVE